ACGERFLDPLRAAAHGLEVDVAAGRAGARDGLLGAAVVAAQPPIHRMENDVRAAAAAAGAPAARFASKHRRVAAAIDEHQALLATLEPRRDGLQHPRRNTML